MNGSDSNPNSSSHLHPTNPAHSYHSCDMMSNNNNNSEPDVEEPRASGNGGNQEVSNGVELYRVSSAVGDGGDDNDNNGKRNNEEEQDDGDGMLDDTSQEMEVASLDSSERSSVRDYAYNWRQYFPNTGKFWHYFRWLIVGGGAFAAPQSDKELHHSLAGLARCLILLREYLGTYGMPDKGGVKDQEYVLREITRDLYGGGVPLWSMEPVMQKVAEGLSGHTNVNWQLFPRKAFVYTPSSGTTSMFKMERGFNIRKMDAMEKVAVRLATFASNTQAVANIPDRFPSPNVFDRAARRESMRCLDVNSTEDPRRLRRKILHLASKEHGLFYYINSRSYRKNNEITADNPHASKRPTLKDFWEVSEEERELFSRLACLEAIESIERIDEEQSEPSFQQNPWLIVAYRVFASAGACAFWFNGGWYDMIVSGSLAVLVATIGASSFLSRQERMVFEVIASFLVGLVSSLIALSWPNDTCFAAMSLASVVNLLQGFRVIFAIIEIMSKHTMAGSADLMEGVLFTGIIAYFLRFGQYVAASMLGDPSDADFVPCENGVSEWWYLLFVPLSALGWSGLFNPSNHFDLVVMCYHGCLAYGVNFALSKAGASGELNRFVSASVVTFSAGIMSRFTGRQAVGNTVAGMYALVPGAYMVKSLYSTTIDGSFFTEIISQAIIIGIGGWTGTILCSPSILGTTRGLMNQQQGYNAAAAARWRNASGRERGDEHVDESSKNGGHGTHQPVTMLYF